MWGGGERAGDPTAYDSAAERNVEAANPVHTRVCNSRLADEEEREGRWPNGSRNEDPLARPDSSEIS